MCNIIAFFRAEAAGRRPREPKVHDRYGHLTAKNTGQMQNAVYFSRDGPRKPRGCSEQADCYKKVNARSMVRV